MFRLVLSTVTFAVGFLAVLIENAEQLKHGAPIFARALYDVDPFWLLRQQWFNLWCGLGVRNACLSRAPRWVMSAPPMLSIVLAAVALVLFLTAAGLWDNAYYRKTNSHVAVSEHWWFFTIVVGTSVTLWVLKIALLGLVGVLGWAAGFRTWGSLVSLAGGSMAVLHLHSLYREGHDVANAARALTRRA
ncbi:MAG: hypothetical protein ACYDAB_09490 [bacterium]